MGSGQHGFGLFACRDFLRHTDRADRDALAGNKERATQAAEEIMYRALTKGLSFKLTMGRVAITDGEMLSNEAIAHFRLSPVSPAEQD